MKRISSLRLLLGLAAFAAFAGACADAPPDGLSVDVSTPPDQKPPPEQVGDPAEDPTESISEQPGAYAGGEDNTFDHMSDLGANGSRDPFEILKQRQEEGPPEVRTRLHSCQKLQNAALRNILVGFGVNIDAESDPPSAGQLFKGGGGALGEANYDARVGEAIVWSAAGAAKLFDIFVQAAPEIIANLPNVPQCRVDGVGPEVFTKDDRCNPDALTCLIGKPATPDHVAICDNLVKSASDIETGKRIAIATLLSAAHSCE